MTAKILGFTRGERYADTVEFLDAIRARHNLASDVKLARFLGWSRSKVRAYRMRQRPLSVDACLEVAAALDLPPAYVVAEIAATQATRAEIRDHWREAAAMLRNRQE